MKIIRFLPAFCIIIFLVFLNGCPNDLTTIKGNGTIVDQERVVGEFHSVTLEGGFNVNIHYAVNFKVVVTTDSNLQDYIITYVSGNVLIVDLKPGSNSNIVTKNLDIDVYLPELKTVKLKGVGNIKIIDGETTDFGIILSGGGNIDVQNFKAENVNIDHSGVGNIKFTGGETTDLGIIFSSGGNIDALNFEAENADVNHSGVGDIKVWATNTLDITFSGGGDVYYKGDPSINYSSLPGSVGRIIKI